MLNAVLYRCKRNDTPKFRVVIWIQQVPKQATKLNSKYYSEYLTISVVLDFLLIRSIKCSGLDTSNLFCMGVDMSKWGCRRNDTHKFQVVTWIRQAPKVARN